MNLSLVLLSGVVALLVLCPMVGKIADAVRQRAINKLTRVAKREQDLKTLETKLVGISDQLERDEAAVHKLAREKAVGFPWLAKAYADYFQLRSDRLADHLESKTHPAKTSAAKVREEAAKRRRAEKLWRVLKHQIDYYEQLFPWLTEFKGVDVDELLVQLTSDCTISAEETETSVEKDPARKFLTPEEYSSLSTVVKYQRALDRYWRKKKTRWEVGRDYERFIGYCYEREGYAVGYSGIVEGFADLGRDLIARRGGQTLIVQCKCWSQHKTIHEKHIFQLFGTAIEYMIANSSLHRGGKQVELLPELLDGSNVKPVFVTSTQLSARAREFATVLGVRTIESKKLETYPCVKCNISRRNGERIYHLPFDQQYDSTHVEPERGEAYVATVAQAEKLGFRRAFRWRGEAGASNN